MQGAQDTRPAPGHPNLIHIQLIPNLIHYTIDSGILHRHLTLYSHSLGISTWCLSTICMHVLATIIPTRRHETCQVFTDSKFPTITLVLESHCKFRITHAPWQFLHFTHLVTCPGQNHW
jgi:hypothetical protein